MPGGPNGFTLTPGSASGLQNQQITLTVTTTLNGSPVYPPLGQAFVLSDGGSGGTFVPTSVTVSNSESSVTFTYANANVGTYVVSAAPNGGSLSALGPQTANITITPGNGQGISSGQSGGNMSGGVFNRNQVTFAKPFIFGTNPATGIMNDVPFAVAQKVSFKNVWGLQKAMGPEGVAALAAGVSERTVTFEISNITIRPEMYLLAMGGSIATVSAIASPTAAPTLTAGAGTTGLSAGYLAVGYAWQSQYGQTLVSPLSAVSITATQQITGTVPALPAGALFAALFTNAAVNANSAGAIAAPVYALGTVATTAITITALPTSTSVPVTASNITQQTRLFQSNVLDEPSPWVLQFQTPGQGGIDQDVKAYGIVPTNFEMDFDLKKFVAPKLTGECFGDPTQTNSPLFTIRQV